MTPLRQLRSGRDRRLLGWLGVGLAVRFALMPFAVNPDLLAVYWRSHLIAFDGRLFGEYLVNMGAHYLHAAWLLAAAPLLPPPDAVWTDPWFFADWGALAPQVTRWFSTQPWSYRTLFVLKVPYLLADLSAGVLLLTLAGRAGASAEATPCHRERQRERAWAFWMLSPIGLYASYLFGRYEMFPVVLVVAALLACERERPWLGAVLLGLAITTRTYPLLLIPVFALVVQRTPVRQAAWAAAALSPLGVTMALNRVLAGTAGEVGRLKDFETGATLFSYVIPVSGAEEIYLFVLFALLVYGALIGRVYGWWGNRPVATTELWMWLLIVHAGFFAFSTFAARYFTWFTPFVFLALARRPAWRGTLPLHLLQCAGVLALADLVHGGSVILLGLLAPMQPELARAWPSLQEVFLLSPELGTQAAGVLTSGVCALTILFAVPAVVELARPAAEPDDREPAHAAEQRQPDERERQLVPQHPPAR